MVRYIHFSCVSHRGKCRSMNQDNFICNRQYMKIKNDDTEFPVAGHISTASPTLFGIFDGLGGEECGEIASFIAAEKASTTAIGEDAIADVTKYCMETNEEICKYARDNYISAMGTTAALLAFTSTEIVLCNIGDSKVFRFSKGRIEQISKDHVTVSAYGTKPPLTQNLGIPTSELLIEPYVAVGEYINNDIYLICSDGLTDMVQLDEIKSILNDTEFDGTAEKLLNRAMENGGKDNISVIVCKIEYNIGRVINKILRKKEKGTNHDD